MNNIHFHWTFRLTASILAVVLIAAACGGARDAETASQIAFAPESYPAAGAADCPQDESGRTLPNVQRLVSVDEYTVRFELCSPDPAFLSKLALAPLSINDSGYLATAGVDGSIVQNPNGTGPWKVDAWQTGTQILMSRFDDYWGDKAIASQLVITWQTESNARLLQVQSGAADGALSIVSDDYAAAENDVGLRLITRAPLGINYYFFNNKVAPFSDVRVRQAVAQAIDRKRITENFFPAGSSVAQTIVPCSVELACKGEDWYQYDPSEARKLLSEAGYPSGFKTKIIVRDGVRSHTPQPKQMAVDLQDQLKSVGIDATIEILEGTTWQAQARAGELDGIVIGAGWVPDYLDPSNYLDFIFLGAPTRLGAPYQDIQQALSKADATLDVTQRGRLYGEIEGLIKRQVPLVPNTYASSGALFRADVQGSYASAVQLERLAGMTPGARSRFVWVLEDEPNTLYCPDDPSSQNAYSACFQFAEGLYTVDPKTALPVPSLAKSCSSSGDGLAWTCQLRSGVKFHNGATFDATDVVDSFAVMWDCSHPWRAGSTGTFVNWSFLSGYLNSDKCEGGS